MALLLMWRPLTFSVSDDAGQQQPMPQLLIYCGITMIRPMAEIATLLEQQQPCKITITKGGSGDMLRSMLLNQQGDLYLPGSSRYFSQLDQQHPGLIVERVRVGENRAVMMVQKGNPRRIPATLYALTSPDHAVVIGNPDSGSVGRISRRILERCGIYEQVIKNAVYLTTDSKDIIKALLHGEADIAINWYAAATWDNNARHIDTIAIDERYAEPQELVLGLLKYSKNTALARQFMALAVSAEGQQIFKRYGLLFADGMN